MTDFSVGALGIALLLVGCNADRPQILGARDNGNEEVVGLPGGGALILQRATQPQQCWVRARGFRGFVPMDCDLAERARP